MENDTPKRMPNVPPFVKFVCANVPMVFDDSLSYYEALCALWKYVQGMTDVINNNATLEEEFIEKFNVLSGKFDELKTYVETYFDNLDVQEEINNKLDAMVEAGTLQEIVGEYLNATATWGFDTVADMKSSTNLIDGSFAQTLGYYSLNDGGGALYKIRKVTNDDTVDEAFLVEIGDPADELVAELVYDNEVSILQLGAKKFDGTKHDIKPYITKYLARLNDTKRFTLKIPYGLYHCDKVEITQSFDIQGDEGFGLHNVRQTTIASLSAGQEYILSVGSTTALCRNFVLKNLTFTSADFTLSDDVYSLSTYKSLDCAVYFRNACFGITDNLFFDSIDGTALNISTSFEIYFKLLNFRNIDAHTKNGILIFDSKSTTVVQSPNISACNFEKIMFEQTLGNLIYCAYHCNLLNCYFGDINFEDHTISRSGITQTTFTDENIPTYEASDHSEWSMFVIVRGGEFTSSTINSIDINNFCKQYSTIDGVNYAYDKIFTITDDYGCIETTVNNINIVGMFKDCNILYSHGLVYYPSVLKIGKVINPTSKNLTFDLDNFTAVECDTRISKYSNAITPFLDNNVTPAYKLAPTRTSTAGHVLKSDSSAQNNTGICVKCNITSICSAFVLSKPTITIRAKIENGATPTIAISGTRYATTQLTGTGDFKVYELTMHANSAIGDTVQLGQPNTSSGEEILIDWIA